VEVRCVGLGFWKKKFGELGGGVFESGDEGRGDCLVVCCGLVVGLRDG
jgi:hypothetical protein